MSLLLEALKKAEKAKEEAQRRAQGPHSATAASPATLEAAAAPEEPAVRTRDDLPDIRRPVEAASAEAPPRAQPELALEEEQPRATPERPAPAAAPRAQPRRETETQASPRAAARNVFEAKFREPSPRLPFFITLGALGAFAIGTMIYFWMQLRPPAPLVNLNPKPPAGELQVAAAASTAPAAFAPAPTAQPTGIPGLPAASVASAAPSSLARAAKPAPQALERAPETPRLQPQLRVPAPATRGPVPAASETEFSARRLAPQVHPKVGSAYAAYQAGDLAAARADYQDALRDEPANRDALLGLAALDVRAGRLEAAEGAYLRLLQADPRDAHAQAALIALRAGRVDPVAAESRVKVMLADNPGAHVLNFTLGNQFAQQGRWAEAQQEYFKAFAAEPENADFAYNLAVSLDHLRQPQLALQYYQRAITLAKARGAGFDLAAAEKRAAQLPAADPLRR
ncbi:MAG TPA: tetratricopeptide repeat protein [Burkholderiales bacterium]|nr:tetratricopeptide repeat protein [Burkholderiales bacterium]